MKLQKITAGAIAPYVQRAAGQDWPVIKSEIEADISEAWRVNDGSFYMVTRVEKRGLIVVLAEGRGVFFNTKQIHKLAQIAGCKAVFFYTENRKMWRVVEKMGYQNVERVYKLEF